MTCDGPRHGKFSSGEPLEEMRDSRKPERGIGIREEKGINVQVILHTYGRHNRFQLASPFDINT